MAEGLTQADHIVTAQDALQNKIQEYFKVSSDLDKWILHVSDKESKGLQLLKNLHSLDQELTRFWKVLFPKFMT